MPSLSDLGEFGLIDRLAAALSPVASPGLVRGIGDDAAVYRIGTGPDGEARVHVVTTDALIEGVHFDRTFVPMDDLGEKAVAVNVSDVCAMNARPRYLTVALGVPDGFAVDDLDALYRGVRRACERYGCTVVGGDVTRSPALVLSIAAIGEAEEANVVYRNGAQVGDLLAVTGDLGASAVGLRLLRDPALRLEASAFPYPVRRHLAPTARLDAVEAFAHAGIRPSAMLDVSDGLASEIHHVCRNSGVGAVVQRSSVPIHPQTVAAAARLGVDPLGEAWWGGEDYELLLTLSATDLSGLPPGLVTVVGRIVGADEGVTMEDDGQRSAFPGSGFDHFGEPYEELGIPSC